VTNGGYNGVQQAFSYGVQLSSGSDRKSRSSARVTGVVLDRPENRHATAEQIRDAVRLLLRDPGYQIAPKHSEQASRATCAYNDC